MTLKGIMAAHLRYLGDSRASCCYNA